MDKPIDNYWQERLADLKASLEKNNFDVFIVSQRSGKNYSDK